MRIRIQWGLYRHLGLTMILCEVALPPLRDNVIYFSFRLNDGSCAWDKSIQHYLIIKYLYIPFCYKYILNLIIFCVWIMRYLCFYFFFEFSFEDKLRNSILKVLSKVFLFLLVFSKILIFSYKSIIRWCLVYRNNR